MGKRKYRDVDEEEYLERRIKKLQKKRSNLRRKRHHQGYSTSSESSDIDNDYGRNLLHEDSHNEEFPLRDNASVDFVDVLIDSAVENNENRIQSVVVQPGSTVPPPVPESNAPVPSSISPLPGSSAPVPAHEPAPMSVELDGDAIEPLIAPPLVTELEPNILYLLGDEPVKEDKFGPCVHKDVASRWCDILVNGLKEEVKKDILRSYEIPDNLKLAQAPVLNPEIKAACNENVLKRDNILVDKQTLLATAITGLANAISTLLTTDPIDEDCKKQILKSLSDIGRLLCHSHFSETQTRRHFVLVCLNKDIKDNIKDLKRDISLFGKDLQESLRSIKAIARTGTELRPTANKPRFTPRNRPAEQSTSRALNWRGQPPTVPPLTAPPHRRAQARPSSTRGGHRPPPPPRRAPEHRVPAASQYRRPWRR